MTLRRWLALCGVAWPILIVLAFTVVGGDTPDDKASAAEVVSYYRDHKTASMIAALMVSIGAVLLVLFAARLQEVLRGDGRSTAMPNAAFGGAVILASGLLLLAAMHFALVQAADHRFAGPAQTLNVIDSNDFFVLVGGIAVLTLASGIATVRKPVLPRWLGWAAIVIGVLSLAGPVGFVGALLAIIWSLVVAIMLLARKDLVAVGPAVVSDAAR